MPTELLLRIIRRYAHQRWGLKLGEWVVRDTSPTNGPATYGGIHGRMRFRLDLRHPDERSMYAGVYEPQVTHLIRRLLRQGDTFVDAGANIGYLSLLASSRVGSTGRVFSFEPQPEAITRLRENIQLNAAKNVQLIQRGCWHESGKATLYLFEDAESGIGEVSMSTHDDRSSAQRVDIETARIDRIVSSPVRLIKADIEGAEFNALRGAQQLIEGDDPPHLILELNTRTASSFGYQPVDILDWLFEVQPRYHLFRIHATKVRPTTRDQLETLLAHYPEKHRNVWLSPDPIR